MTPDPYGTHWRRRIRPYILNRSTHCYWCHTPLATLGPREVAVDHVVPLADGGTNHPSNLVASCRTCNSRRNGIRSKRNGLGWYRK